MLFNHDLWEIKISITVSIIWGSNFKKTKHNPRLKLDLPYAYKKKTCIYLPIFRHFDPFLHIVGHFLYFFLGQIHYIFIYRKTLELVTPVRTFIVTNSRKIKIGTCWTTQMKDILISYTIELTLKSPFFGCWWGGYLLKQLHVFCFISIG